MRNRILECGIFLLLLVGIALDAPLVTHAADIASQNYQVLAPVITTGGGGEVVKS